MVCTGKFSYTSFWDGQIHYTRLKGDKWARKQAWHLNEVAAQTDTRMMYRPSTNMHTSNQRDNDKCDWKNISINQITTLGLAIDGVCTARWSWFVIRFSFFDIQLKVKLVCFSFLAFPFSLFVFRFSTFEFGRNIAFWHSKSYFDIRIRAEYRIWHLKSYFDIRTWAEYRILTFKILFWHSNTDRISNFDIRNPILTFEFGPNIEFWHSKSYFDIRIRAEYRILTFEILFWHSNSDWISNFDIQNSILTFEFGPNIEFWHSKSYFDIRIRAEYRILTLKILFWHSNSGRISNFDIQNPILTFELGPNIEFWHSKSYFDIRTGTEYRILTFEILFWHSNSGQISNFDIQNPILTFEFGPNIEFWHSKSYFDIRTWTEYQILTFKILFWHSNSGRISNFDIHNPILIFEFGPNIAFWHSKSYFDIRIRAEYRILTIKILFWHSNSGRI